jgi:hypothetical protein
MRTRRTIRGKGALSLCGRPRPMQTRNSAAEQSPRKFNRPLACPQCAGTSPPLMRRREGSLLRDLRAGPSGPTSGCTTASTHPRRSECVECVWITHSRRSVCAHWQKGVHGPLPPPWLRWQGESGVQSYDLDGVGSIPAMPRHRFPALLIISINKNVCFLCMDRLSGFEPGWIRIRGADVSGVRTLRFMHTVHHAHHTKDHG